MSSSQLYQKLAFDDEPTEALLPSSINVSEKTKIETTAKLFSFSLSSIVIFILIILNSGLAVANIRATREVVSQALTVMPFQDVMHLNKPDQYYGLSDESRAKRKYLC
jgi:hypothetical protein